MAAYERKFKGADVVLLQPEREAPRFQAWVRARLDENTPYDVLVERILTATGAR